MKYEGTDGWKKEVGECNPEITLGSVRFTQVTTLLSQLLGQHWRLLNRVYALTMFKLNTASFLEKQRVSKSRAERELGNHLVEPCLQHSKYSKRFHSILSFVLTLETGKE